MTYSSIHYTTVQYRPVALLPVISKLAERHVQQQILQYLENTGQVSDYHHGFRERCSTTTVLIEIMDTIAIAADENTITATMSIDESAAFDCVQHSILEKKLEYYGLDTRTRHWIHSYLENRSGYVSIGSGKSNLKNSPHGVPQGSVLGPLMYLIYVNDMPMIVEDERCESPAHRNPEKLFGNNCTSCGKLPTFADDAVFLVAGRSRATLQDKIETKFEIIKQYLNSHGLEINDHKTSLTEFMLKQKRARLPGIPPDLTVGEKFTNKNTGETKIKDKHINDSTSTRMLGMNLQNNLTWESHLLSGKKPLLPGIRKQLGTLYKLQNFLSRKTRLQLINTLVISRLGYGISLWGNTTDNFTRRAQIVLNMAGRFVTGWGRTASKKSLMIECKWLDVQELACYHSLLQMFKSVRWNCPAHISDRISEDTDHFISTSRPRLQITANAYRWKTIDNWNSLPLTCRTEKNISKFKLGVKKMAAGTEDGGQRERTRRTLNSDSFH